MKHSFDEPLSNSVKDMGEHWGQVHVGHAAEQSHPKVMSSAGIQHPICTVSLLFLLLLWASQRTGRMVLALVFHVPPDESKPSPQL